MIIVFLYYYVTSLKETIKTGKNNKMFKMHMIISYIFMYSGKGHYKESNNGRMNELFKLSLISTPRS
jgi:hypothetical protein